MSESETKGRCRKQIEESYAHNLNCVPRYAWITADAIDRLAADVAAVKDMAQEIALRVPSEFGQDACDVAVRVLEKDRDAAIRKRDEARALLELAQVQRTAAYADRDEARAEVYQLKCSRTETSKERDAAIRERDQWKAKARRAVINRDEARAKIEKLKAMFEQQPPAAPQPAAPPAGWLRDDERDVLEDLAFRIERWVNVDKYEADGKRLASLRSILARAGSPPVVEVPVMVFGSGSYQMQKCYRAAMDRAGVAWKEVEDGE